MDHIFVELIIVSVALVLSVGKAIQLIVSEIAEDVKVWYNIGEFRYAEAPDRLFKRELKEEYDENKGCHDLWREERGA